MDYSERLMRGAIRDIPGRHLLGRDLHRRLSRRSGSGAARSEDRGDDHGQRRRAHRRSDRHLAAGLRTGRSTCRSRAPSMCAIWLTLRSILLDSAVYGNIPQNSGLTRPITIVAPKGTLANPIFPAPTIARFCPGQCARRHRDEGAGAGRARAGERRDRQSARHRLQRHHQGAALGAYGDSRRQLRRPARSRRHGCASTRFMPTRATIRSRTSNSHLPLRVNRYELREGAVAPGDGAAVSTRSRKWRS